jgi:isopenicillin N synthase-like dioxygenase
MKSSIPVIDLHPFLSGSDEERRKVASAVNAACRDVGFLVVVGHGIPQELIDRGHAAARRFFDLDEATKHKHDPPPGGYLGYRGLGAETLAHSLDEEAPVDLKETFTITRFDTRDEPYFTAPHGSIFFQPNPWPAEVPELQESWVPLYRAFDSVATTLMRVFALALDLPERFFDDKIDKNITALRALNYPHPQTPPLPGQLRAGAHTDFGSLTLLSMQDAPGGLQVNRGGDLWEDVKVSSGALVTNIGDLMAQWTNDAWTSTLHRVVNPPEDAAGSTRRQSIAFFHQPNHDAEVIPLPSCVSADRPARYERTTSGEHLYMKISKSKAINH